MGKGAATQGYRYYMSLLSGLCRAGATLIEIKIGDKEAWSGEAHDDTVWNINAPDLFGGDDKEGGIQGPFRLQQGYDDQVIPSGDGMPDLKGSIGGLVSQMRGVTTLWFDGMVSAMSPYLKTWKFRVRRTTDGWAGDPWYPEKATVVMGGDNLSLSTNRPIDFPIVLSPNSATMTFSRNPQQDDTITVNGIDITYVAEDTDSPGDYELKPNGSVNDSVRTLANYINARSTTFKATASYVGNILTVNINTASQAIKAMNGSHIIWQCFTDPLWGRGLPSWRLDENSFVYAANTLCNENFGIALIWYRKEDIDVFIQKICDIIGAVTYTDRETGKIVLKLVRADYLVNDLPLYTPETGLLDITDDDSASSDNSYNEIIGSSTDPVTGLDFQVRAQNLAGYQSQQAVSSLDQDYKGLPTKALLSRVVLRDLRAMASGLKKFNVTLDRRAWRVAPGSVIRISHPGRGIANLVLRVGEIDDGNMVNGAIKIKAAIDVFGLPATSYAAAVDNGWIAPSRVAVPAPEERLIEAGYRDLYLTIGSGDAQTAQATDAYIGQMATAPNSTSLTYDLISKADGEPDYVKSGNGAFTGNARLAAALTPLQTEVDLNSLQSFSADNIDQVLMIDDELVRLDAFDGTTATIARGVGDTVPQAHAKAAVVWTIDDDLASDGRVYSVGETVHTKVLTRTSSQILDPSLALDQTVTLIGRHALPYPPADVKVDGQSIYAATGDHAEPVLTWASRNRITQADHAFGHTEASIAGEVGQTYTIRVYSDDGMTLLRTVDAITDLTWTYDAVMQAADGSPNRVLVKLESARDDLTSWQHYSFAVVLIGGWDYSWGNNYG